MIRQHAAPGGNRAQRSAGRAVLLACCTALRGMLAKPRFSRGARAFRSLRISKSRLNPKGLRRRFAPVAGLAEKAPKEPEASTRRASDHLGRRRTLVSGMAGRYATALFDLARETNAIDAVKADLERFDALVAESADLERLVRSPVFSADEQLQALSAVLERAGIGGLAAKFLKLVTSNRRLFAVRDMIGGTASSSPSTKARRRRKSRSPSSSRTNISRRCALRSRRSAARTSTSRSRSIPPSSAGSWSSSAAAWSTPRCAPSSMRSGTR